MLNYAPNSPLPKLTVFKISYVHALLCNVFVPSSLPLVPCPFPITRHTTALQPIRTGNANGKKKLCYSKRSLLLTDQIINTPKVEISPFVLQSNYFRTLRSKTAFKACFTYPKERNAASKWRKSMSISELEIRDVKLPPKETFLGDLTAQQIVEKINAFHRRLQKESRLEVAQFAESYFLNLIALYPVSMCSHSMSDELKLVVALFFFGSKPTESEKQKWTDEDRKFKELFPNITPNPVYNGYSYDDLALIFDRNKSSIVDAVKQKQEEAKIILEEATLRSKSEKTEAAQLIAEEKNALIQDKHGKIDK